MDETRAEEMEAEELPAHKLEPARSSRSRCKTCKRKIDKGVLRLGLLVDGAYGPGYMWHHLTCLARRRLEAVEEAYAAEAWEEGLSVPPIEELRKLGEKAQKEREQKKTAPYVELAPSGRSRCKQSGETIPKGSPRVVLLRSVEFYGQVRSAPINVLPEHVREELSRDDSAIDRSTLADELRANSDLPPAVLEETLTRIGDLG